MFVCCCFVVVVGGGGGSVIFPGYLPLGAQHKQHIFLLIILMSKCMDILKYT